MKSAVPSPAPPPKRAAATHPKTLSREKLAAGIIGLARYLHAARAAMSAGNPGAAKVQ